MEKIKPEQVLERALGFDEDDLNANRNLYLSAYQYRRMTDALDQRRVYAYIFWYGMAFIALLPVLSFAILHGRQLFPGEWLYVITVFTLTAIVMFFVHQRHERRIQRLPTHVEQHTGRVKLDVSGQIFLLSIGQETFVISKTAFLAFKNHEPYTIYTHGRQILSAEWLNDSPFIGDDRSDEIDLTESNDDAEAKKSRS